MERKIVAVADPINLKSPDGWISVYRLTELECGHYTDTAHTSVKVGQSIDCWDCRQKRRSNDQV